jgi:hypothetical protein
VWNQVASLKRDCITKQGCVRRAFVGQESEKAAPIIADYAASAFQDQCCFFGGDVLKSERGGTEIFEILRTFSKYSKLPFLLIYSLLVHSLEL